MEIVNGSILDATEKYIAHIVNAVSPQAGGLAHCIYRKFPYANIYSRRTHPYTPTGPHSPGHITVHQDKKGGPSIINMITQHYPGPAVSVLALKDGGQAREKNFYRCLETITKIPDIHSIAFPYRIGCGEINQGNWDHYMALLSEFDRVMKDARVRVVLYRKDKENEMA
jgi:hypothetical protein